MKQETLKKIVELADGFTYERIYDPSGRELYRVNLTNIFGRWSVICIIEKWEHYPLLLHRAVQGWNRQNEREQIKITRYEIIFYRNGYQTKGFGFKEQQPTKNLTPEEVAIEKALIFLLEVI